MRFLLALIVGILIGAAVVWYYQGNRGATSSMSKAGGQLESAARNARDTIQDKLRSFHLSGGDISNEIARTGRVIRQKAQEAGTAISNATADSRITGAIKARLLRDPDLSAWDISVNTTDGIVTLSGTTSSAENIGKAVLLAMETDGVRQVISTMQIKSR
jgi:osmotically-inducible protein OsmY